MKNVLFILIALLIGCSSSTDSGNQLSAHPDLDGTWDIQYAGGGKSYSNTETIKTSDSHIMFQGKSYGCEYKSSTASWGYKTSSGYEYGYYITLTSKDEFSGIASIDIPQASMTHLSMVGKRK